MNPTGGDLIDIIALRIAFRRILRRSGVCWSTCRIDHILVKLDAIIGKQILAWSERYLFLGAKKIKDSCPSMQNQQKLHDNKNATVGKAIERNVIYLVPFQGFTFEVVYTSKKS